MQNYLKLANFANIGLIKQNKFWLRKKIKTYSPCNELVLKNGKTLLAYELTGAITKFKSKWAKCQSQLYLQANKLAC